MTIRQKIEEQLAEENPDALLLDGFDNAIVGIVRRINLCVVAYDSDKCVECLVRDEEMSYDDAIEWFEYNVRGAFVGEHTPVFIESIKNQ